MHREPGDRDAVLRQGELRVRDQPRDQVPGAVQQEARHRHMVLRQAVLPQPRGEPQQAHDQGLSLNNVLCVEDIFR